MVLVEVAKERLATMRDEGWDTLLNEAHVFYNKHEILIPNMEDAHVKGRRCKASQDTNLHNYQVDLFYPVIDIQLQELNGRFNEVSTEPILCIACLNHNDSFSPFNVEKLLNMTEFYPCGFFDVEIFALKNQLDNYTVDVHRDARFANLKGIGDPSNKIMET
ncbi:uncharacterized protein LOC109846936 [Asparagus officinalis]|uniref:uncharacterized protein LOC109846936 n=1 Tax=Asparagus officinalis TaxID=4686 RepID=UPI00098E021B|nr:uncharacterized protein LOC109846936 [Asparagus officinalis]